VPARSVQQRGLLLSGARLLATTHDLVARCSGLALAAADETDARVAAVYLRNIETGVLSPVASAGAGGDFADKLATLRPGADDATAVAAHDRSIRSVIRGAADGSRPNVASPLLGLDAGLASTLHLPLVCDSPAGGSEVEGVLVLGFDGPPPAARRQGILAGLVALLSVAAQQARLEIALTERSDWLDRLAHTDALTGLANRRALDRVLAHELARAARWQTELGVAMFAVDGLDRIRSEKGDAAADNVLRAVGAGLAGTVRLVDAVARTGPDGFVVVGPVSDGVVMATRAAQTVARMPAVIGRKRVSVSAGVASYPVHGETAEELLAVAEKALKAAQKRRPGTVVEAS
jgi:diguanylate cyclase (GGDEF)-like protein